MKYYVRSSMYKSSTGNCTFNPDTVQAYSYGWWCFVKKIRGKTVFNSYRYSNTTSKHQAKVRALMRDLGLAIDVTVSFREGLQHVDTLEQMNMLHDEQIAYDTVQAELRRETKNRRARERRAARKREEKLADRHHILRTETYPPLRLVK